MFFVRKPSALQWTAHSRAKSLHWTQHSRDKMRFYGLSEQRVKRVIHSPRRVEEGIAPKTVAMMQPVSVTTVAGKSVLGTREETWKQEIWVMVQRKQQTTNNKKQITTTVISAWRYPGRTKPGQPLPTEILRELRTIL